MASQRKKDKKGHRGQDTVEAAGGLVVRRVKGGAEIAVVHRSRYDDWSLPKGKLEPGESFEAAALREVEEESGLRCSLGRELPTNSYRDHKGRQKTVRWYLMEPLGGSFEVNEEVDELRWLSSAEARELLDYEHDRLLVGEIGEDAPA